METTSAILHRRNDLRKEIGLFNLSRKHLRKTQKRYKHCTSIKRTCVTGPRRAPLIEVRLLLRYRLERKERRRERDKLHTKSKKFSSPPSSTYMEI